MKTNPKAVDDEIDDDDQKNDVDGGKGKKIGGKAPTMPRGKNATLSATETRLNPEEKNQLSRINEQRNEELESHDSDREGEAITDANAAPAEAAEKKKTSRRKFFNRRANARNNNETMNNNAKPRLSGYGNRRSVYGSRQSEYGNRQSEYGNPQSENGDFLDVDTR